MDVVRLMDLTNKMLKRPGMQAEIVRAMLEDQEIRDIVLRESGDLDNYLLAAGVAPAMSLLPPGAAMAAVQGHLEHQGISLPGNLMAELMGVVTAAVGDVGRGLRQVVRWLKERLHAIWFQLPTDEGFQVGQGQREGMGEEACTPQEGGMSQPTRMEQIFKAATTIAIVAVLVLVFKRPPSFAFRRVVGA